MVVFAYVGHTRAHCPQLFTSFVRFTRHPAIDVSHCAYPALQATPHTLLRQYAVAFVAPAQTPAQLPQCAGSKRVSTQLPPQSIVGAEQLGMHVSVPVLHTRPPVHVVVPATQRSIASSQVSTPLQAMPSEQLRAAPEHMAPAEHVSLVVQKRPSSQGSPVRGVHADVDIAVLHVWHWFPGFVVDAA